MPTILPKAVMQSSEGIASAWQLCIGSDSDVLYGSRLPSNASDFDLEWHLRL